MQLPPISPGYRRSIIYTHVFGLNVSDKEKSIIVQAKTPLALVVFAQGNNHSYFPLYHISMI